MTNEKPKTTAKKAPAFVIYEVVNRNGKKYWNRVGAAFKHGKGDGLNLVYNNGARQVFDALYRSGQLELELVPQGNLAERLRAAGAGIGAFFTPTGFGTELARNADGSEKETRVINGKSYVLEYPILGDVALIKAERGDRWGNLTYRKAARNFGPVMATAAKRTIASVYEIAELGSFDPEAVVTPGIHVSAVVRIPRVATQAGGFKTAA